MHCTLNPILFEITGFQIGGNRKIGTHLQLGMTANLNSRLGNRGDQRGLRWRCSRKRQRWYRDIRFINHAMRSTELIFEHFITITSNISIIQLFSKVLHDCCTTVGGMQSNRGTRNQKSIYSVIHKFWKESNRFHVIFYTNCNLWSIGKGEVWTSFFSLDIILTAKYLNKTRFSPQPHVGIIVI
jgi:hypothetical protein